MKIAQYLYLPVLFAFSTATACGGDASGNHHTPSAGPWKVAYFFDYQEGTNNYTNYTFEFGANGSLIAAAGSQTWAGTWATGLDDSTDKFVLDFSGAVPNVLSELEEDWRIIRIEDNFMHFVHTSGGNGDTEVLKFGK